jgi:hypothetical protein
MVTQETPRLIWKTKVHYRVHKTPPLVCILNQINRLNTPPPPRFSKIHSNITLVRMLRSSKWSLSFGLSD